MENQFNYNMSAMPLCWPTYILRHFLDIPQPTYGCLELKDAESAKKAMTCNQREPKQNDDRPSGQTQTQTLPLQPLIGWQAAASPTPTPACLRAQAGWSSWIFVVFLRLFHLTSLEILIDSQLNIIANWLKGFKRFNNIIFTFARSRSQNGCQ